MKKGVSPIIATVLIISLTMVIIAVLVTLTRKTVEEKIEKTEACGIENLDKFSINRNYVCYDGANSRLVFSIDRGDVEIDKMIVSVRTETSSNNIEISSSQQYFPDNQNPVIFNYDPSQQNFLGSALVSLPAKKSGRTYILTGISQSPSQIQIVPVVKGEQCEIADIVNEIPNCSQTTIL